MHIAVTVIQSQSFQLKGGGGGAEPQSGAAPPPPYLFNLF